MAMQLTTGKKDQPKLVVLVGGDGIGKTSLAISAPNPVVLDAEGGSDEMDVARIEGISSFDEMMQALDLIIRDPKDFKSVIIDSLSKIEPWIWDKFDDPGYGKGAELALGFWRKFTASLDKLRAQGMNIILIAHSWPMPANDPTAIMPYDKMGLRLDKKAAAYIREYVYGVFYMARVVSIAKDNKSDRKGRAIDTKDETRIVYTSGRPAFDAKSRYELPSEIRLPRENGWETIFGASIDYDQELKTLIPTIKDESIRQKATDAFGKSNSKVLYQRVIKQIESERQG